VSIQTSNPVVPRTVLLRASAERLPRRLLAHARTRDALLVVLFIGAVLASRALYLRGKATLAAILIRKAWDETLKGDRPTPPWPWADTHPIARLQIPSLGYDELVLEGASGRNMAFGPTRLMNAAAPGEPGNVVLAGHRTSWFQPLQHVRDGDALLLLIRDPGARGRPAGEVARRYRVVTRAVIAPSDTSYLQPTPDDRLTLITCWPFGRGPTSPQRYVVQAVADGAGPAPTRSAD
jgi:sortase A